MEILPDKMIGLKSANKFSALLGQVLGRRHATETPLDQVEPSVVVRTLNDEA